MRYSIQLINSDKEFGQNYRITDNNSDSRVATCYLEDNADLVCEALNFFEEHKNKPKITKANLFRDSRPLWQEHHRTESERLQKLLISKGFLSCSIGEAEGLWMGHSDDYAAGFLGMPEDDEELYNCVKDKLYVSEITHLG